MTDTLRRLTWEEVSADGGRRKWRDYLRAAGLRGKDLCVEGKRFHTTPNLVDLQYSSKRRNKFLRTTLRRDRMALPSDPLAETFEKV